MRGNRAVEKEYRHQRRASRKAHVRLFLEELALIAFLGGVLVFGGFLLTDSFTGPGDDGDAAETGRDGAVAADTARSGTPDTRAAAGPEPSPGGTSAGETTATAQPHGRGEGTAARGPDSGPATPEERTVSTETPDPGGTGRHALSPDIAKRTNGEDARSTGAAIDDGTDAGEGSGVGVATQADTGKSTEADAEPEAEPEPEPEMPAASSGPERQTQASSTTSEPAASTGKKASAGSAGTVPVAVKRATFTYDVVYDQPREPVTYIDYAETQAGRLYFFTETDAAGAARLVHEWRHEGEVVARYEFEISGQDDVRVSHYELPADALGTWRVYVRDGSGEVLRIGSALYQ